MCKQVMALGVNFLKSVTKLKAHPYNYIFQSSFLVSQTKGISISFLTLEKTPLAASRRTG